jgi:hypothetical protein
MLFHFSPVGFARFVTENGRHPSMTLDHEEWSTIARVSSRNDFYVEPRDTGFDNHSAKGIRDALDRALAVRDEPPQPRRKAVKAAKAKVTTVPVGAMEPMGRPQPAGPKALTPEERTACQKMVAFIDDFARRGFVITRRIP